MSTTTCLRSQLNSDKANAFFHEFTDDRILNLLNTTAPIWFREELRDIVALLRVGVEADVFLREEGSCAKWQLAQLSTLLGDIWDRAAHIELPENAWPQLHRDYTAFGLSDLRDRDVLLRANTLRLALIRLG